MSSHFIQVPIEEKVGKGNRLLRPLNRDPLVEVAAYRDNQFKVSLNFCVVIIQYSFLYAVFL